MQRLEDGKIVETRVSWDNVAFPVDGDESIEHVQLLVTVRESF